MTEYTTDEQKKIIVDALNILEEVHSIRLETGNYTPDQWDIEEHDGYPYEERKYKEVLTTLLGEIELEEMNNNNSDNTSNSTNNNNKNNTDEEKGGEQ